MVSIVRGGMSLGRCGQGQGSYPFLASEGALMWTRNARTVNTIARHGSYLAMLLEKFDDLALVCWLNTRKQAHLFHRFFLDGLAKRFKLLA